MNNQSWKTICSVKKKKDAEDMSEPKVHTADSPHTAYSKLFPAEDGEGVRFFFAGGDC